MPGPSGAGYQALLEALKKQQIGGAVSIPSDASEPHTIPLIPGLSVATVPRDRDLTPEEKRHEEVHAMGGLPLSAVGTVGSALTGLTSGGTPHAYLSPDEVLAYMMQPSGPATTEDMKTIESLAEVEGRTPTYNPLRKGYLALVQALAKWRQ